MSPWLTLLLQEYNKAAWNQHFLPTDMLLPQVTSFLGVGCEQWFPLLLLAPIYPASIYRSLCCHITMMVALCTEDGCRKLICIYFNEQDVYSSVTLSLHRDQEMFPLCAAAASMQVIFLSQQLMRNTLKCLCTCYQKFQRQEKSPS